MPIKWDAKRFGPAPKIGSDREYQLAVKAFELFDQATREMRLAVEYQQPMSQLEFDLCCKGKHPPDGKPYPWQKEFHDAGAHYRERALICPNQVGKTRTCAAEVAIHATGRYPSWWEGYRFSKPVRICMGSETNELLRDVQQLELYGPPKPEERHPSGTGWIPLSDIEEVTYRQCGISSVFDECKIKHVSGGTSVIKGKTYEQGWERWQGTQFDLYWLDEEPQDKKIYSEVLRGLVARDGKIILSRTPLLGRTWVIDHFMQPEDGSSVYMKNISWAEAPHLTEERKSQILSSIPEHERDTRSKGTPMMGEGVIYPIRDEALMCDPFPIPKHYRRIAGLDFGDDHPTAACWLAHDADQDVIYIYDVYRQRRKDIPIHASAINSRGNWIPVAYPHDAHHVTKGGGDNLKTVYTANYVNMMHASARYDDKKGGAQPREPVIQMCFERMMTGRLKVFNHLNAWFEEKRMYHRKDGKVVAVQDDILSAMHYAIMMLRYARTNVEDRHRPMFADVGDPLAEYTTMG